MALANKNILLGVTGGIAAYKAAEMTRRLREAGAAVRVVMTRSAQEFITPLTFQALSGHPVRTDLLDPTAEAGMGHIELARWADAVLVAPASADFMARLAHGRADDLLATLCLATDAPIALAPAMNRLMWGNAATQANRATLERRGVRLFGPGAGDQACGETGEGRMLEPEALVSAIASLFSTGTLGGLSALITAGPTREAIDPVRYLTNRSSGRMGFALARAAAEAGAQVTLVSGPVMLLTPKGVERIDVETALDMHRAVMTRVADAHVFIACAAVADYRAAEQLPQKLKKSRGETNLALTPNPDILAEVAALPSPPFTLGFAAETENLEKNAQTKLISKQLDMLAANWVHGGGGGATGRGFDSEENALEVFWPGGHLSLPKTGKEQLARQLITLLAERYAARNNVIPYPRAQDRSQNPG